MGLGFGHMARTKADVSPSRVAAGSLSDARRHRIREQKESKFLVLFGSLSQLAFHECIEHRRNNSPVGTEINLASMQSSLMLVSTLC